MPHARFGTAITCMDGRVQESVAWWLKEHYHVEFVDMITEPGVDKVFVFGPPELVDHIKAKVHTSTMSHGSRIVAVSGHHDCAGNPVSDDAHCEQVRAGVCAIRQWSLPVEVVGLWISERWEVEEVII